MDRFQNFLTINFEHYSIVIIINSTFVTIKFEHPLDWLMAKDIIITLEIIIVIIIVNFIIDSGSLEHFICHSNKHNFVAFNY